MKSVLNKLSLLSIPAAMTFAGCGMPPTSGTTTTIVPGSGVASATLPANCMALDQPLKFVAQSTQISQVVDPYGYVIGSGLASGLNPINQQYLGPVLIGSQADSAWSMLGTAPTSSAQTGAQTAVPSNGVQTAVPSGQIAQAVPSNGGILSAQGTNQDGTLNIEARQSGYNSYFLRGTYTMSPTLIQETRCKLLSVYGIAAAGTNLQNQMAQCQAYNYQGSYGGGVNGNRWFGQFTNMAAMGGMIPQPTMQQPVLVNGQYVYPQQQQVNPMMMQQQMLTGAAAAQGCISGLAFQINALDPHNGTIIDAQLDIYLNNMPSAGVIAHLNNSMAVLR